MASPKNEIIGIAWIGLIGELMASFILFSVNLMGYAMATPSAAGPRSLLIVSGLQILGTQTCHLA